MVNDNGIGAALVFLLWMVIGGIYEVATNKLLQKKIKAFVRYARYTMAKSSLRRAERRAEKLSRKTKVLKRQFNEAVAWFR